MLSSMYTVYAFIDTNIFVPSKQIMIINLNNKTDSNGKIKWLIIKESEIPEFVKNEIEFFVSSETKFFLNI